MNPYTGWPKGLRYLVPCCALSLLVFVSQLSQAQMVANYDYTDKKPSNRLRPPLPPTPPPKRLQPKGMVAVVGVCGGILGNPPLRVSLVSLDRDSYAFGDTFIFVVQIKAVYSTRVPVRASMAEIEPSDPNLSYEWGPLGIRMDMRNPTYLSFDIGLLELYGSKEVPGSEIELKSGEWIELRGKARMQWTNPRHGVLPASEEKYLLQLRLMKAQEFSAYGFASRAESYHFDAATKQETRVCHSAEQSGGGNPIHLTITPKVAPNR